MRHIRVLAGLLMVFALVSGVLALSVAADPTPVVAPFASRVVLRSTSHYLSDDGQWVVVVGEVENVSDVPLSPVRVMATFRDGAGRYLGRDAAYALVTPLPPGGRAPFLLLDWARPGFASYDLRVSAYPAREDPPPSLDLSAPGSLFHDGEGHLILVGEVANPLDVPVRHARVIVTFYDAEDKVLNVAQAQVLRQTISPGERSPFVARVEQGPTEVDHWRAQALYETGPEDVASRRLAVSGVVPYMDRNGYLVIRGTVYNGNTYRVNFVRVVAALYDGEGRILNASFSYPLNYHLAPGASDVFEVKFREHFEGWASYRFFVEGSNPTASAGQP